MKVKISDLLDLSHTIAAPLFEKYEYPWQVLPDIESFILEVGPTLPSDEYDHPADDVWIAKDATVFDSVYIQGPLIVGHKAEIRQCAFIRGKAIVGHGATVGNSCELKNCILFDDSQIPHYNYCGDSVIGYKSHIGAGGITSNLKSDKTNIAVKSADGQLIETGLRKMGAILGDNVEVGCNSVLNPGTVIGRCTNVYPTSCVRGFIPANSIYKDKNNVVIKS